MKTGRQFSDIAAQILAENKAKRDFVADTSALTMTDTADLTFPIKGEQQVFSPTGLCLQQIADRVGIPRAYADRMRTEAPALLARNVNHWFQTKPEKRMLRTLCNGTKTARAFLSERYRPFDNMDLAVAVKPKLDAAGCIIRSAEITESRLYIQASTPRIQSVIEQNVVVGTHNRIQRVVEAGVIIGNSEVGCGSIFIEPILYDLVCTNGLVVQRTLKRHHVGRRNEGEIFGEDGTFEMFSDDTRKLDDQAFWAKVSDVVTASLDQIKFDESVNRLRQTQQEKLADATKPDQLKEVVEEVADRCSLLTAEKEALLLHFMQGGDASKYGLINAVTRTAQDVESYDRAVDLERLGGRIIELPASDFAAKN